ncbi:helix-turn-helix domain-containing protein [Phenylobacterium sp.]|uniref:helix-turn-helix domain-containing protein n=1 Tax=Phenylobacterium sp. TaxID=1871053 RepID=UPI00391CBB26
MDDLRTDEDDNPPLTRRDRALGLLSFAFILDEVATGIESLAPLDAMLVMAINQANIAPLTREPLARMRYGRMEAAAPDARRRPVSINAVAASLRLPFETTRRRVRRLQDAGACAAVEGGVIVPEEFLTSPGYVQSVFENHNRLRAFFYEANAAGLVDELPRSAYPPEATVPVRAAARLLSDYMLRTLDMVMGITGDVVGVLVLLAALGSLDHPQSIAAIAQRLRMPPETVRRHVNELVDRGLCVRDQRGVDVPEEFLDRPLWRAFLRDNAVNVQRLFAGLAERGVIEAWFRLTPPMRADVSQARSSSGA